MLYAFFKSKQAGAALPSVFIAMVGSGFLFYTLNGVLSDRETENTRFGLKLFQRLVHEKVLSSAANPVNIYMSINSSNFRNCLKDTGSRNCRASDYREFSARQYYNGRNDNVKISGPKVYFNATGLLCEDDKNTNCPFTAKTFYKINCFGSNAVCNEAETISVVAQISWKRGRYKNAKLDSKGKLRLKKFPKNSKDIVMDVFPSDISSAVYQQCPAGANARGFDRNGVMECSCAPGFEKVEDIGVKLKCENIKLKGIGIGKADIVNGRVKGTNEVIKCDMSRFHKLVYLSGLTECALNGPKDKINTKVVCSNAGITYKCVKFSDEHIWAEGR